MDNVGQTEKQILRNNQRREKNPRDVNAVSDTKNAIVRQFSRLDKAEEKNM